jgi:hypothetical protein
VKPIPSWSESLRAAWRAFWPSRLVVFGAAIWVTTADLTANAQPGYPKLSHPFSNWPGSGLLDLVFSPLAKWDALHYLAISLDGYVESQPGLPPADVRPAFFPLFPGLVHVLSWFGASPGVVLIMAYAVSLAAFLTALVLMHRLAVIEIGDQHARTALMLLAFFPLAFFFGLPYTESLFLLLAVAVFLGAREGRWALVGVSLALASATRVPGLLLFMPALLIYLYGPRLDQPERPSRGIRPRYPLRWDATWLLLVPVGLLAYSAYLHFTLGDALQWQQAQELFGRHTVDPFTGAWHGLRAAGESFGTVFEGKYDEQPIYYHLDIAQVGLVAVAVVAGIAMLRNLPVAYGTWVLISLLPIFVSQPLDNPLFSAGRFISVLFPIFFWLARVCDRRGSTQTVIVLSAAAMAVLTAEFALWSFVS